MRSRILLTALAGLSICFGSTGASALSLAVSSSSAGSTQTGSDAPTGNPLRDADWTASTTNAGGATADLVSNSVAGSARYTAVVAGDDDLVLGDNADISADLVFTTTFSISAGVGVVYDLTLDTNWAGVFHVHDETGSADMTISNALASVSGCDGPCGETNQLTLTGQSLSGVNGTTHDPFSDSGTFTIAGLTGNKTITLVYDINTMSIVPGLQDVGILLGEEADFCGSALGGCYDGGTGLQSSDGLFVSGTVTITAVPEPGTVLLLGSGLAGLVVFGRRRA